MAHWFLNAALKSILSLFRFSALHCVAAERRQHNSICYFRGNYIALLFMPPQGLELREQFPHKYSCCFPTRKIMDGCKTSGIFLSLCRQLNRFEAARQPLSVLVAWDRWWILWSLTATSLKWSTKWDVSLFFSQRKAEFFCLSFCCDSSSPKGFIPNRGHKLKGTRTSNFRQERRTLKWLSYYFLLIVKKAEDAFIK